MKTHERVVRKPVAAGTFYPAGQTSLRRCVDGLLDEVHAAPASVMAMMVPHAGYAYSGKCAAQVFGRVRIPDTVVMLGPNHSGIAAYPGCASLWSAGEFATPLGHLPIDEEFAEKLLSACPRLADDPLAHRDEHSLEVELPFLLVRAAPRVPSIVPILVNWDEWAPCAELARSLAAAIRARGLDNVLLLGSSDMTHFESAAEAMAHDRPALDAIRRLDGPGLLRVCEERGITMCGSAAVSVMVDTAKLLGAVRASLIMHTHSGVGGGDTSSVVSYAGVVID
ncbi:AmmeMemoRadiSam system protein B [Opitutaceae bacterium EW11]|nr:AmmeMemoRadiSam system protein B [Opitutaceae bacterium EW11]